MDCYIHAFVEWMQEGSTRAVGYENPIIDWLFTFREQSFRIIPHLLLGVTVSFATFGSERESDRVPIGVGFEISACSVTSRVLLTHVVAHPARL